MVETVTAEARVPLGQNVLLSATARLNDVLLQHEIDRQFVGEIVAGLDSFVTTQSVRLYSDSEPGFVFHMLRSSNSGTGQLIGTISGYLVDCGAGPGCPIP